MISSVSISAALVGISALSGAVRAQECQSLVAAAGENGRSAFVDVIGALPADDETAAAIIAAATSETPIDPPFTVFVPENSELAAAGEDVGDDTATLINVLATHVVAGTITGEEIADGDVTTSSAINNVELFFTDDSDDFATVAVAGSGNNIVISDTDIPTCAGLMHLINKVLIPGEDESVAPEMADEPAMAPMEDEMAPMPAEMEDAMLADAMPPAMEEVEDMAAPPMGTTRDIALPPMVADECENVVDALTLNDDTAELAAVAAQLLPQETLEFLSNPENNLTVLAPSNEVVSCLANALGAGIVTDLDVIDVLTLHVIPDFLEAADVLAADGAEIDTANINGAPLMVMVDGETVMFAASETSMATVVETDVDGCGAAQIIHRIDGVLIPPSLNITVADLNCEAAAGPASAAGERGPPEGGAAVGVTGFLAAAAAVAVGFLAL